MKQAVIDIGSNSIRMTAYETNKNEFKILFREKIMAGLAGYVKKGKLTDEGVDSACKALKEFKHTLESLNIGSASVFATASLRNISNTEKAVSEIEERTEFKKINVLSGEQEATYGYIGAMRDKKESEGVFVDVGGASTEIVLFRDSEIKNSFSFAIGSLNLYKKCVKKILPGSSAVKKIEDILIDEFDCKKLLPRNKVESLICVGGTSRAVLKIAKKYFNLSDSSKSISKTQTEKICNLLTSGGNEAVDIILKLVPERVHTIVPGIMILNHIMKYFDAKELIVSNYGVREGYLCQEILQKKTENTSTRKTEI